jgi:uncharacterized protein involved in exopolysaccharide biosynthesis
MVENLAAIAAPVARMEGIDLQGQLAEATARRAEEQQRLAERLQESARCSTEGDKGS